MRIRTIKPEFFTHDGIFEAEEETGLPLRLAYIGLWCAADREGRFRWEPRRLRVQILPYDDVDFGDILHALVGIGCVQRYGERGEYGNIPSFLKHQCINQREAASKIPEPSTELHVHARAEQNIAKVACNIPGPVRQLILERDGRCVRCSSTEDLTIDHIFPRSIGGNHSITNLRTLCRSCNSARPVQGKALLDDLAKDGFTLDDMPRMCLHVHAHAEGKGREGNMEGNKEQGREGDESATPPAPAPEKPKRQKFIKPTLDEWTAYAKTMPDPLAENQALGAWDYYEGNGWRVGRNPMADWQATLRAWARRQKDFVPARSGKMTHEEEARIFKPNPLSKNGW